MQLDSPDSRSPSSLRSSTSPRARGEVKKRSHSRDASASEFCAPSRSFMPPPIKEGGRAPKDAPPGTASFDAARALVPFSPLAPKRTGATGTPWSRRARLSAPYRGFREGCWARSGSARASASWNHRMQTGGPSPAPVQRAPRRPALGRTGMMLKPPANGMYRSVPGNRPRSAFRSTLAKSVLRRAGFALGNYCGDGRQGSRLNKKDAASGTIKRRAASSLPCCYGVKADIPDRPRHDS